MNIVCGCSLTVKYILSAFSWTIFFFLVFFLRLLFVSELCTICRIREKIHLLTVDHCLVSYITYWIWVPTPASGILSKAMCHWSGWDRFDSMEQWNEIENDIDNWILALLDSEAFKCLFRNSILMIKELMCQLERNLLIYLQEISPNLIDCSLQYFLNAVSDFKFVLLHSFSLFLWIITKYNIRRPFANATLFRTGSTEFFSQ